MLLIFDLDGTLIDSSRDLAISVNATRAHLNLPPLDHPVIQSYVGNGAAVLVRRAMEADASDETVAHALKFFLSYYREHSLENTRLYPGIADALEQLAASDHRMAVLTNKPTRISGDILNALQVGQHFFRIIGGDSLQAKKPDPTGIHLLIEEASTTSDRTWMIGDSEVDIQTARNADVRACGVMWGFKPELFAQHPPDLVVAKADELVRLPE